MTADHRDAIADAMAGGGSMHPETIRDVLVDERDVTERAATLAVVDAVHDGFLERHEQIPTCYVLADD